MNGQSASGVDSVLITGLLLWVIKSLTVFVLRRHRIRAALLLEIERVNKSCQRAARALGDGLGEYVQLNERVLRSARYTPIDFPVYQAYLRDMPSYFSSRSLTRITRFYDIAHEVETLIEGLFIELDQWVARGVFVKGDDLAHIQTKVARIQQLAGRLPPSETPITSLRDMKCPAPGGDAS